MTQYIYFGFGDIAFCTKKKDINSNTFIHYNLKIQQYMKRKSSKGKIIAKNCAFSPSPIRELSCT